MHINAIQIDLVSSDDDLPLPRHNRSGCVSRCGSGFTEEYLGFVRTRRPHLHPLRIDHADINNVHLCFGGESSIFKRLFNRWPALVFIVDLDAIDVFRHSERNGEVCSLPILPDVDIQLDQILSHSHSSLRCRLKRERQELLDLLIPETPFMPALCFSVLQR